MAGDMLDASKIDSEDIIDAEYDDIPEEHHQAFEAYIKHEQEEDRRKFLSCYERTRQGVIKKEEFIMPTFLSPTTFTSMMSNVSIIPTDFIN